MKTPIPPPDFLGRAQAIRGEHPQGKRISEVVTGERREQPPWTITPEKVAKAVRRLIVVGQPRKIILFGSYARGQSNRDSDLDILVVTEDRVENSRRESVRLRSALSEIPMPMDILVVREGVFNRLKDKIGLIYREALRTGKVVYEAGSSS